MPDHHRPTDPPPASIGPPRLAQGIVPEAPERSNGLLIFALLATIAAVVATLRTISAGTPFVLVEGIYFPAWFSAGCIGAALAWVTLLALRSHPVTRAAGTALVFFNCGVIYAFLSWLFLFS